MTQYSTCCTSIASINDRYFKLFVSQSTQSCNGIFWRTFYHDGKISPGWCGWECTPTPFHYVYHHEQSCSVHCKKVIVFPVPSRDVTLTILSQAGNILITPVHGEFGS
jgi:hypothetical protein